MYQLLTIERSEPSKESFTSDMKKQESVESILQCLNLKQMFKKVVTLSKSFSTNYSHDRLEMKWVE